MKRVHELDALRGFALAGITFMNILQMTGLPRPVGRNADRPVHHELPDAGPVWTRHRGGLPDGRASVRLTGVSAWAGCR